jgi:RNA 3'-terminal phosphate cyclase (ATP)
VPPDTAAPLRPERRSGLDGARIGSELVRFSPGMVCTTGGRFVADTRTAGSCTLIVQIVLPCLVFGGDDSEITCIGGTNVSSSPSFDEMALVLFPLLARFGVSAHLEVVRRGFYPKGRGELRLRCTPSRSLTPIELVDRGELTRLTITVGVAGRWCKESAALVSAQLTDELTKAFGRALPGLGIEVKQTQDADACDDAAFVCVSAVTTTQCLIGASEVTDKKTSWKEIVAKVVPKFLRQVHSKSCLDEWVADQVLIFMALAQGTSRIKLCRAGITPHFDTGTALLEKLLGVKFRHIAVAGDEDLVVVECCGVGYTNRNSSFYRPVSDVAASDGSEKSETTIASESIASSRSATSALSKEEALRRFMARKAARDAAARAVTPEDSEQPTGEVLLVGPDPGPGY